MQDKKESRYKSVASDIEKRILSGEMKPGEKLLSENELREKYNLSRQTIRNAIAILEKKGLVDRVQGSGTYVAFSSRNPHLKKNTIALIMTYVDGYIFPRVVQQIQNVLFEQGYSVQLHFTNNRMDRERVILEEILQRDEVAGIIAEATKSGIPNPDIDIYKKIMDKKIPVLFINSFYNLLDAPHVSMDDTMAGYRATQLLIDKGHSRIAGLFKLDDGQGHLRFSGFTNAMSKNEIEWHDENIIWYDTEDLHHFPQMKDKFRERFQNCTGLVTYNDEVANVIMPMLKEIGYRIPEDLSIASIDDSELATIGEVKLSSVPYPLEALGKKAAQNMLKMIEDPYFDGNYEFDEPITERSSVREI